MPISSPGRIADVFVEVADTLVDDYDVIEFLQLVADRTAELLGASDVGLLLADQRGQLQFAAASNERVERLEFFQVQNQEGPCLEAFRSGAPVIDADFRGANDRWPGFVARASAAGIRSVHAIPLQLRKEVIGAMGVFGQNAGGPDAQDVQMARALAHVATIGLLQERTIHRGTVLAEQLQTALNSRIVIEQAKGALAERAGLSVEDAFSLMRNHARRTNRRLGELAQAVLTEPDSLSAVAGGRKSLGRRD